jgi:hypothetical protein
MHQRKTRATFDGNPGSNFLGEGLELCQFCGTGLTGWGSGDIV